MSVRLALVAASCTQATTPAIGPGPTPPLPPEAATTGVAPGAPLGADPLTVLTDGFLWAYPLVFTERVLADSPPADAFRWHLERADERLDHVSNPDVLYGVARLDLRAEPAVLHATTLTDRYWSAQLSDDWVESDGYVGTRATGGLGGDWLVVGPDGPPADAPPLPVLVATTSRAEVIARLHVTSDADVPAVDALEPGYSVEPLSAWLGAEPPPAPEPPPTRGREDDTGTNGVEFWDELGDLLLAVPPRADEGWWLDVLAPFGVGPGRHPGEEGTDPATLDLLEEATVAGLDAIRAEIGVLDDWVPDLGTGRFEGDVLRRAAWCSDGWVTQEPEEAVYTRSPLFDGAVPTSLRFAADELPPVGAFWSVAVYGDDGRMIANPWDRFSVQSTDPAVARGADGSLEVRFAATDPGGPAANWLPVDASRPYMIFLRAYLPGDDVLEGRWLPPDPAPL